jgi:hypothetical protein
LIVGKFKTIQKVLPEPSLPAWSNAVRVFQRDMPVLVKSRFLPEAVKISTCCDLIKWYGRFKHDPAQRIQRTVQVAVALALDSLPGLISTSIPRCRPVRHCRLSCRQLRLQAGVAAEHGIALSVIVNY